MGYLSSISSGMCIGCVESESIDGEAFILDLSATRYSLLDGTRSCVASSSSLVPRITIPRMDPAKGRNAPAKGRCNLVISFSNESLANRATGGSCFGVCSDWLVLLLPMDTTANLLATLCRLVHSHDAKGNQGRYRTGRFEGVTSTEKGVLDLPVPCCDNGRSRPVAVVTAATEVTSRVLPKTIIVLLRDHYGLLAFDMNGIGSHSLLCVCVIIQHFLRQPLFSLTAWPVSR
jgi:hypothetical protein